MSRNLFGMHDYGNWVDLVLAAGKSAWCVNTEAIGCDPNDHGGASYNTHDGRITHITRLNNGYGSAGTIPLPDRYGDFAQRCANFVAASNGCNYWIIGNEIALGWEWPEGQQITLDNYVRAFALARSAIKRVKPDALVMPQPPAPWNTAVQYPGNEAGDWVQQLPDMLNKIGPGNLDAIALHIYAMSHDPGTVTGHEKMDPPFNHRSKTFQAYREYMAAIPGAFKNLPVLITESNPDGWENTNNGWIQNAYAELNHWNQDPNNQPIRCLAFYRWPTADRDKFHISTKGGVIDDYKAALQHDYIWPERALHAHSVGIGAALGAAALRAGQKVTTQAQARLRVNPGVGAGMVATLDPGKQCVILSGPEKADDLQWYRVTVDAVAGWIAQAAPDGTVLIS